MLPAEDVEFLVKRLDLLIPGGNVKLECVPHVSPLLQVLDITFCVPREILVKIWQQIGAEDTTLLLSNLSM